MRWWIVAIIALLSALQPLAHFWIERYPGEGRVPTGMHKPDTAIFIHCMRMFDDGFFSPYATCLASVGPNSAQYFPAPFHWMYGIIGAAGKMLGVGEFVWLGLMNGLGLAIFAILIYLWFRFEWQFALGAMIANVHDIVLTIGYMSLTQIDFDLSSIAALLTILGYSLNDTVVIYDRIREMLRRYKRMPMPESLNDAVREARRITDHEGKRRQVQYVGRVMRGLLDSETAALRTALDSYKGINKAETARLHWIERTREKLLADDAALTEFIRQHPAADPQEGRTLIRNARKEQQQAKPPRYFRELFQWIKNAAGVEDDGDAPEDDDDQADA